MNIQQLKYALEISRQGSFNKASQSLFLSQPALSNAIKDLETELGYSIFIRDRKNCQPTDEGRSFLQSAHAIIQEWENIQKLNHTLASEKNHILKISSDRAAFVCKAFLEFHKEDLHNKKYSLHLYEGDSSQVVNDILTRACDIGVLVVLASDNSGWMNELKKRKLAHHFLFRTGSYIILRNGHPLLRKKEIRLNDIYPYPLFRTSYRGKLLDEYNLASGFSFYDKFEQVIYTDSMRFMYKFIEQSDSIFIGSSKLHVSELHPQLSTIPLPGPKICWEYYYIHRLDYRPPKIASDFITYLKQTVEEGLP